MKTRCKQQRRVQWTWNHAVAVSSHETSGARISVSAVQVHACIILHNTNWRKPFVMLKNDWRYCHTRSRQFAVTHCCKIDEFSTDYYNFGSTLSTYFIRLTPAFFKYPTWRSQQSISRIFSSSHILTTVTLSNESKVVTRLTRSVAGL